MHARVAAICALLLLAAGACSEKKKDGAATEPSGEAPTPGKSITAPEPPVEPAAPPEPLPADSGEHKGEHVWSKRFGSPEPDAARALLRGPGGELVVAGYYRGEAPMGEAEKADGADGYVAVLDDAGAARWIKRLGGPGDDTVDTANIDAEGNVLVAGSYADSLIVGDGSLPNAGADDIFIAKFAPDGRRLWAKGYGGGDIDAAHFVTTDKDGNVYLTGVFRASVAFGETTLESNGDADIFLAKLGADGEVLWAKSFGALGPDYGRSLAVLSSGDIVLMGEFSRGVDFGGGELGSNGNRDVALARFGADGTHRWSISYGNNMDELAIGMTVDPSDSIVVTGSFDDDLELFGQKHSAAGRSDILVAKFDAGGKLQWSRSYGGKDEDIGAGVDTDRFGNIYATGWFWFTTDFGRGDLRSNGKQDVVVMKLDPAGSTLWAKSFGGKEADFGKGILAEDEAVTVAGTFHTEISFGGDKLVQARSDGALVPKGDIFLVRLSR